MAAGGGADAGLLCHLCVWRSQLVPGRAAGLRNRLPRIRILTRQLVTFGVPDGHCLPCWEGAVSSGSLGCGDGGSGVGPSREARVGLPRGLAVRSVLAGRDRVFAPSVSSTETLLPRPGRPTAQDPVLTTCGCCDKAPHASAMRPHSSEAGRLKSACGRGRGPANAPGDRPPPCHFPGSPARATALGPRLAATRPSLLILHLLFL